MALEAARAVSASAPALMASAHKPRERPHLLPNSYHRHHCYDLAHDEAAPLDEEIRQQPRG
jgi:hypothetical protein